MREVSGGALSKGGFSVDRGYQGMYFWEGQHQRLHVLQEGRDAVNMAWGNYCHLLN